jgi:hypothetical protein
VPFLRVIRDRRGYETTYLMHWYRDGYRQRTKILYVFRSPMGGCVGRSALEPDVMRELQAQFPGIDFDWSVVRENKQVVESAPEPRRRPRRVDSEGASKPEPAPPGIEPARGAPPNPPRPPIPAVIDGVTPDEKVAFLTTWYPVVRDRVPQRSADPARQEALLALAERLNPAAWTDADEIASGLPLAAEALDRLSHVFARRRRRPRKRPGEGPPPGEHADPTVPPHAADSPVLAPEPADDES